LTAALTAAAAVSAQSRRRLSHSSFPRSLPRSACSSRTTYSGFGMFEVARLCRVTITKTITRPIAYIVAIAFSTARNARRP
ncbi:hypothetical protein CLOP_g16669, partial [Closterium sp. NIES-67]